MQGSSGESLARLSDALGTAIDGGADGATVGDGLFAAADVLRDQPALRRAATDPSSPAEAKRALVSGIFGSHLDSTATEIVGTAAGLRWASSGDLARALEQLGVVALVKAADAAGEADRLEDDLFRFGRAVVDNPELRDALSDPARSAGDKRALVRSLLEGKAAGGAIRLAERSVSGVHLTVARALDEYGKVAAETRNRLVALVRTARPLEAGEQQRLADVLARQYSRPVHLNVVVDQSVVGGLRLQIGDQVIDGTIASRLDDARRRLVG
ncbi:F-type H+-transporting ATPase subunit delta [Nocardioides ginsengisegetis]|uniref:ATP synthase subunit delta n=1 Tax=Nocardioides ginsengisegetis TaxID=661491 RepID=A0A7W3IY09_9ACTN|nr:F0F1 ATP synthase subunit delta [Nocardioides ginsengisegetis]MBA8802624.1 F-type H+-transporting ATPase subunit delta [Nocardioides ginsengisegetis]